MALSFGWKKRLSYMVAGALPLIFYMVALFMYKDFVIAASIGLMGLVLGVVAGPAMIAHPIMEVLEGKGLLVLDMNSSGIAQFFIAKVMLPNLYVKTPKGWVENIYNRTIGVYLPKPKAAEISEDKEIINIKLPKEDYTSAFFKLESMPMLIWNSKLDTFLTKEILGDLETKVMTEHLSLLLLDQIKTLRKHIRELTRHGVDQFKPNRFLEFMGSKWGILLIVIVAAILIFLFVGPQLPKILGYVETAGGSFAGTGSPVTPLQGGK